jgi:hypothetical protein
VNRSTNSSNRAAAPIARRIGAWAVLELGALALGLLLRESGDPLELGLTAMAVGAIGAAAWGFLDGFRRTASLGTSVGIWVISAIGASVVAAFSRTLGDSILGLGFSLEGLGRDIFVVALLVLVPALLGLGGGSLARRVSRAWIAAEEPA